MFRVNGRQILALQGAGGEPFTAFVDALLRAHGAVFGLVDADIDTTIRANIRDGGVDTAIRRAVAGDWTGWLSTAPTAWQYKGTDYAHVRVGTLLRGAAVRARIEAGDGFRLALADSLPGDTRREWEQALTDGARAIRADAPEARIVTADDLAAWASRYAGLVLGFFRPDLVQIALHLEAWRRNIVDATPRFVPVAEWAPVRDNLTRHVSLSVHAARAVVTVHGEAGIGKTRLAYEVVAALSGAEALVVYSGDEDAAIRVATELANDGEARAVLVADECGAEGRLRLERTLAGHRDRVRVVAIDNSGQRVGGIQPELQLGKMPRETLTTVLDLNYPDVPPDRRRAYATLAEGFPRLAADLCAHDALIAGAGHVGPVVPAVSGFLQVRLTGPQLEALAALALVTKAGYSADVATELDALCAMLVLPRATMERALHEIHDGPGFVARTSRYFYVTPELVAQVAYQEAWRRWGRDPSAFFEHVPEELLQQVLDRAWRSAPEEVRRACAAHFRDWAQGVTPEQLRDVGVARRLVALADTHPTDFVPRVRMLVEAAPPKTLTQVRGEGVRDGGWGPRRSLVWLAERFAQFEEYFDDAERILLRLAIAESEPGIGNNATAIWCQLYRVYLSGTAVPFVERRNRLRSRLLSPTPETRRLAAAALNGVFEFHATRMLGPAVVAGRLPPEEWRPRTVDEEQAAFASALNLLGEIVTHGEDLRAAAVKAATDHLRSLVGRGFLSDLRTILSSVTLTDEELAALVEQLDGTLAYDFEPERGRPRRSRGGAAVDPDEIEAWRDSLSKRDLHTRLVTAVGKDQWAASRVHAMVRARETGSEASDDPFVRELEALADELLRDRTFLQRELPWLTSDAARSAGDLGEALGRRDVEGSLVPIIMPAAEPGPTPALARGYVHGLLTAHPRHADIINTGLDEAEERVPAVAAELAISAGELVRPVERVVRMFDARRIPPAYLADRNFASALRRELTIAEILPLLERLAAAAEAGDDVAERIGLDTVALRVPYDTPAEPPAVLTENPPLRALAWRLLEARPPGSPLASRWWRQLVVALGRTEPARAARLAGSLLGSDDFGTAEEGQAALRALAPTHPSEVMETLGRAMLDDKTGWRFFIGKYDDLVDALPVEIVRSWLERAGVEGARRIARHLPAPTIDAEGKGVVPPLTEWVLETFGGDERTFREFCAGVHNLELYSGDIAAQHEAEATLARRFLDHRLRRVREWAAMEERSALAEAQEARRDQEERDLP